MKPIVLSPFWSLWLTYAGATALCFCYWALPKNSLVLGLLALGFSLVLKESWCGNRVSKALLSALVVYGLTCGYQLSQMRLNAQTAAEHYASQEVSEFVFIVKDVDSETSPTWVEGLLKVSTNAGQKDRSRYWAAMQLKDWNTPLGYGDVLQGQGNIALSWLIQEQKSLWPRHWFYIKKSQEVVCVKKGSRTVRFLLWRWRHNYLNRLERFRETLGQRGVALYKAIVLGDRKELSQADKEWFSKSGSYHILAISGMHIMIVFFLVSRMFQTRLFQWRWIKLLCLLCLGFYTLMSGAASSVVRATIMIFLAVSASLVGRRQDSQEVVLASGLILSLVDPSQLFQVGFWLSYLAVLGIIEGQKIARKWPLWLRAGMVPVWASLATAPLISALFGSWAWISVVSNVFILPLMPWVLGVGLVLSGAPSLATIEKITQFVAYLADILSRSVYFLAQIFSQAPVIEGVLPLPIMLAVYGVFLWRLKNKNRFDN